MARPKPTVRGWIIMAVGCLALVGAAWLGRVDLLLVGVVLTLLPPAAMIALSLDRPWLTVSRSFSPDMVATGQDAQATLTVRNLASRAVPPMRWREVVGPGLHTPGAAALPWLGESGPATRNRPDTTTMHYRIGTRDRGVYDVGPVLLSRLDPFGLARAEYAVGGVKQLLVTPRVQTLPRGELDTAATEGTEYELLRHSIPSADELIAREYRTGDPLRRVHWRATARHDKLMVRQEEQRSDPNAWILFDTARQAHAERHPVHHHGRDERFERAVSLVAALGTHLLAEGFTLNVVETGRAQLAGRAGGGRLGVLGPAAASFEQPAGYQQLLADLATVRQIDQGGRGQSRFTATGDVLAEGLQRDGSAVPVFAVLLNADAAELAALGAVRHHCDPAVAFLLDDSRDTAREPIERAGFTCVALSPADDAGTAWQKASRLYARAAEHG